LDNGLYREYNDQFRLDYSNLWLAILNANEEGIKKYSLLLGVNDYRLFASMLTTRSWRSIQSNTLDSKVTQAETNEIIDFAQTAAFDITDILSRIPSDLLLLFKCNDMIRAIVNDLTADTGFNLIGVNLQYCQKAINLAAIKSNPGVLTYILSIERMMMLRIRLFFYGIILQFYSFFSKLVHL